MNKTTMIQALFTLLLIPKMGLAAPCFPKLFSATVSSSSVSGPTVFRNISAALNQAAKQGACSVEIEVQAGHYSEANPVILELPAVIKGAGVSSTHTNLSLRNRSGHTLTISNISFVNSPLAAITQSGGKLKLDGVNFDGTTLDPRDIRTGTALLLFRGATGSFRLLTFSGNLAGAIRASESGTSFYCGVCVFTANQVHPLALAGGANSKELMGSVSLVDGALGSLELASFTDNQMVAIQLKRARAFLKNTTVQSSVPIGRLGGIGLLLQEGSQAIGERVRFMNQPLAGISLIGSRLTLRRSVVQGNVIGMAVQEVEPGFEYFNCMNDTQFRDNQTNLDAAMLPAPTPSLPGGPAPAPTPTRCPNWPFPTNP